jgi:hypothetical protein
MGKMPVRTLSLITAIALAFAAVGCAVTPDTTAGSRAQLLEPRAETNRFVGDWGPGAGYVANDWIVRFSADGRVSVRGPGMTGRGTYVASGGLAHVSYSARDGGAVNLDLLHGDFSLSPDGQELTFTTGLPNDPPVHLRRIRQ